MPELLWSLAPWITFFVGAEVTTLTLTIAVSFVAGAVVFWRALYGHPVHMLTVASVVYFLALGAFLALLHPTGLRPWEQYAQAGAHAVVTLLVFGSILIGRPFTQSYAKGKVSGSVWGTAQFTAFHRRISVIWGLAFLIGTVSLVAVGALTSEPLAVRLILRIIVPFGALVLAYVDTQRQLSVVRASEPTTH